MKSRTKMLMFIGAIVILLVVMLFGSTREGASSNPKIGKRFKKQWYQKIIRPTNKPMITQEAKKAVMKSNKANPYLQLDLLNLYASTQKTLYDTSAALVKEDNTGTLDVILAAAYATCKGTGTVACTITSTTSSSWELDAGTSTLTNQQKLNKAESDVQAARADKLQKLTDYMDILYDIGDAYDDLYKYQVKKSLSTTATRTSQADVVSLLTTSYPATAATGTGLETVRAALESQIKAATDADTASVSAYVV